jgi:hypothetical protein
MSISIDDATNVLTLSVLNTSPTTLNDGTGVNAPGIDGFGFNLNPDQSWSSWSLTAYAVSGDHTGVTPVVIGSSADATLPWGLAESQNNQGIIIDYNPNNGNGVDEALYNPAATSGIPGGSNTAYYTEAVFTIAFDALPVLAEESCGSGLNCTTFIRMQNVGSNGGGSLKLPGVPGTGPGPGPGPIPVPAPLALIGLGGLMLGWMTRKSRA